MHTKSTTTFFTSRPPNAEEASLSFETIQRANTAFNAGLLLEARELCTKALIEYTPYHPVIYANRACVYGRLGYHDLAAGDAYKAVMLMEYIRAVLEGLEEDEEEEVGEKEGGEEAENKGATDGRKTGNGGGGETTIKGEETQGKGEGGGVDENEDTDDDGEPASIFSHIAQAAFATVSSFLRHTHNLPPDADIRRSDLAAFTTKFDKLASFYLINSLRQTGSLLDAYEFCESTLKRYPVDPDEASNSTETTAAGRSTPQESEITSAQFQNLKTTIMHEMNLKLEKALADQVKDVSPEKSRSILTSGVALRQRYPWNHYEPDRFCNESLAVLNENMTKCALNSGLGAVKCEAKVVNLPDLSVRRDQEGNEVQDVKTSKHLGIFATEDIYAGEVFFVEGTTIAGAPHPGKRIVCDYCTERIVPHTDRYGKEVVPEVFVCQACSKQPPTTTDGPALYPAYCSELCLKLAQESHHHPASLCGREDDLSWIYDDIVSSPNPISMYSVLLIKILSTSINKLYTAHPPPTRPSTDSPIPAHPLLLPTIKHLYGVPPQNRGLTMRWDFVTIVVRPIWILTQCLNIDIYSSLGIAMFDTWVINTLMAKIMGTCSGRFEPLLGLQQECDDRPDVVNIHPTWSLVNHDCEPNVGWRPEGKGRFWGIWPRGHPREGTVWGEAQAEGGVGKHGEGLAEDEKLVAVRKGEEVKSCYTDRKLDYKMRREWAKDMLGGDCMCHRCLKEENEELEKLKLEGLVKKTEGVTV